VTPGLGLGIAATSVGLGFASALVPVLNIEAYLVGVAAATADGGPLAVLGATLGQTVGKVVLFVGARRGMRIGRERHRPRRSARPPGRWRRRLAVWSERGLALLDRPWPAAGVVLTSASVGIPPLAVTSIVAGTRRTPLPVFLACCLVGRLARFVAIVVPVMAVSN
jgi:membrane protein YqaA with SNARE-associated domain